MKSARVLSVLVAVLVPACVILGGGDDDVGDAGTGGGDAGGQAVADCQDDCEQHLFFDCIDADRHEECRNACESASESDIATFGSCCQGALPNCDQATDCVDNFLETGNADESGGGSGGGGDDGSLSEDGGDPLGPCVEACEAIIACGFENPFPTCEEACESLTQAQRDALAACLEAANGCEFPEECIIEVDTSGGG